MIMFGYFQMDYPYKSALFGLVSYNDPCQKEGSKGFESLDVFLCLGKSLVVPL